MKEALGGGGGGVGIWVWGVGVWGGMGWDGVGVGVWGWCVGVGCVGVCVGFYSSFLLSGRLNFCCLHKVLRGYLAAPIQMTKGNVTLSCFELISCNVPTAFVQTQRIKHDRYSHYLSFIHYNNTTVARFGQSLEISIASFFTFSKWHKKYGFMWFVKPTSVDWNTGNIHN